MSIKPGIFFGFAESGWAYRSRLRNALRITDSTSIPRIHAVDMVEESRSCSVLVHAFLIVLFAVGMWKENDYKLLLGLEELPTANGDNPSFRMYSFSEAS